MRASHSAGIALLLSAAVWVPTSPLLAQGPPAKPDPPAAVDELPAPKTIVSQPAEKPKPADAGPADAKAAEAMPVPAAGENGDRYKFNDGYWWYWTDSGRWVYYRDGKWWPNPADVKAGKVGNTPLAASSHAPNKPVANADAPDNKWRMVSHDGRWWYLNPDETWSVYLNNQWVKYDPTTFEMITAQQMAASQQRVSRSYSTYNSGRRYYRSPSYYNRGLYPSIYFGSGSPYAYPGGLGYPGFGYPYGYGGFGGYPYYGGSGIRIGIGFN